MVFRIGGLASGMDVDTLVSDLMKAHRVPVDKLNQQRQTTIWQRESYLELNSKMYDYRNNKLFEFKKEATLTAKKVDLSGDTSVLSARATGTATSGTLDVRVNAVASAAMKKSNLPDFRSSASFNPDNKLATEDVNLTGNFAQDDYEIKINGVSISINRNEDSLNDVIERINKSSAKVTAYYANGQVSFTSKETGVINGTGYINFVDDPSNSFFSILNIDPSTNTASDSKVGSNASVTVNDITTTSTSNVLNVNGVELTVKAVSGVPNTTVMVTSDTDKVIEAVKGFVKDYNEMLKSLQSKVSESKYRSFVPLSEEQKKDMKENDIKLWEEKAKSGLLRNDTILNQTISEMRNAIMARVDTGDSKYTSLSSIGIETGLYSEKGKLYLNDEAKLRKAIEENPDAVVALFTGNSDTDSGKVGIAERIYTTFDNALDEITKRAGTSSILQDSSLLGKKLEDLTDRIDGYTSRLSDIENRYYRQFTAMEQAINRMNAQSASLAQSFGQG